MEYIRTGKYFAQVTGGLERLAADELIELGAKVERNVPRGLFFSADKKTLYQVVYSSRLIQRVLAPLVSFDCPNEDELYRQACRKVDWPSIFSLKHTFSIQCNVSDSRMRHSLYAGQKLKDAICDSFRHRHNARPDFSTRDADVGFNLHIHQDQAVIALDVAGKSMHKRGYRQQSVEAPIQETLAAAMIRLSNWQGDTPLYDIMCGSGTILAEALMYYCRIPAGFLRADKGVQFLPDFDLGLYDKVRDKADSFIRPLPDDLIFGADIDRNSLSAAKANLSIFPEGNKVKLYLGRFQDLPARNWRTIITNPPYGVRLGDESTIRELYNDLGDFLKQKSRQSEAYILCGDQDLASALRLRSMWKKRIKNGDIEASFVKVTVS